MLLRSLFVLFVLSCGFIYKTDRDNKKDKNYTILGLGDSITQGTASCSYLFPLKKKLETRNQKFTFIGPNISLFGNDTIWDAGFSGRNAEFLDERIQDIYQKYPADFVLLHAGHNHFDTENPVSGIIEAQESMIRKIISINPMVKILVAKVIHAGKLPKYSYIPALNEEIEKMVKKINKKNVILVDVASSFDWEKHTIPDHVHPNLTGSEVIANTFLAEIKKIVGSN